MMKFIVNKTYLVIHTDEKTLNKLINRKVNIILNDFLAKVFQVDIN